MSSYDDYAVYHEGLHDSAEIAETDRDRAHRRINQLQARYEIACRDSDWQLADEIERTLDALREAYPN